MGVTWHSLYQHFIAVHSYFIPGWEQHTNIVSTEESKYQLDATWYFIVLLIGSTCFKHYYAHHLELATVILFTTLVMSFCRDGEFSVNNNVIKAYPSFFTERNDQCGKQQHTRELLMMGLVVPETCWAYKKYNKTSSGIYLIFFLFFSYKNHTGSNKHHIILLLWTPDMASIRTCTVL